jgi:hypothetical protein
LINIYDDEESLEVSLVTPVQIIEEKEPEKASSLAPDAQIHLPQSEQEVESVLDTKLPNAPIPKRIVQRMSQGHEQKEEAPQLEIDVSTIDNQVSTEPTPMPQFQSVLNFLMRNKHKPYF